MATGAPVTSKQLCLATETNLSIMQSCLNPDDNRSDFSFGALRAILNSQDSEMIYSTPSNHAKPGDVNCPERTVYQRYLKPDCDPVGDMPCPSFDCEVGAAIPLEYESIPVILEEEIGDTFTIDASAYGCQCDTDPIEAFQIKMKRSARKGLKAYQNILVKKMIAGVGTDYAGNPGPISLPLFTTDGKPQPMGFSMLQEEYSKQNPNCPEDPIILTGSGKFNHYLCSANVYSGNTDGFDPNKSCYNVNSTYFDRSVQDCFTATNPALTSGVLAFLPGTVHVASWYRFESEFTQVNPNGRTIFSPIQSTGSVLRQKMDIGSAIFGIPFVVDMQIVYNECKNTVTYTWCKSFDLCKAPQTAFCSTYNYCNLFNIVCEDIKCIDLC